MAKGGAKGIGEVLIQIAATTAGLQAEFNKTRKELKGFSKDFANFKQTIEATIAFKAIDVTLRKTIELGKQFGELAKRGEEVSSIEDSFKRLGGSNSSIEQAKQAVLGTIGALDLMRIQNQGLIAQGPAFTNYFADIAKFANQFADATGRDAKEAVETLTQAISKGASKELKQFGIELGSAKSKAEVTMAALRHVAAAAKSIAPEADNAGKAFEALNNEMTQAINQFAVGVSNSESLRVVYRELAKVLEQIDWKSFGQDAAEAFAILIRSAGDTIPTVIGWLKDLATGLEYLSVETPRAAAAVTLNEISRVKAEISNIQSQIERTKGGGLLTEGLNQLTGNTPEKIQELQKELTVLERNYATLIDSMKKANEEGKRTNETFGGDKGGVSGSLCAAGEEAKKAAEEVAKLEAELKKTFASNNAKGIEKQLAAAIQSGNAQGVAHFTEEYKKAIAEVAEEQYAKFDAINPEMAASLKAAMISEAIDPMLAEWQQKQEEMFQESVDFFRDVLVLAIDGTSEDFKRIFKEIAVGFGAQILASITGGFKFGSPMDLGGQLAGAIFGGGPGSGVADIGGALGIASAIGGSQLGGFMAAMGSAGSIGPVASGAAYSGMLGASGMGLAGAMPYVGAGLLAAQFAPKIFGSLKKRFKGFNRGMDERRKVQEFLEQQTGQSFDIGSSGKFNEGAGGFDALLNLDTKGQGVFGGLGSALQELLGLTENIGPQIGAILAENLNGNLDKAKELTKELGFSQEDMENAVIKAGLAIGKTWVEIQGELFGIHEVFAGGTTAAKDLKEAIDNLAGSANVGMEKLSQLRAIAATATAQGVTSMAQLKEELMKVWDPKDVEILFEALATYGIDSLDALQNASDRTVMAILAMMQALGFSFKQVADNADEAANSVDNLGDKARTVTGENPSAAPGPSGESATRHARGGIISRRSTFRFNGGKLGLAGEVGPEAILPLTRVNGVLGVRAVGMKGDHQAPIIMDLRGAGPGVGEEVKRAISEVKGLLDRRITEVVMDNTRRGTFN